MFLRLCISKFKKLSKFLRNYLALCIVSLAANYLILLLIQITMQIQEFLSCISMPRHTFFYQFCQSGVGTVSKRIDISSCVFHLLLGTSYCSVTAVTKFQGEPPQQAVKYKGLDIFANVALYLENGTK